MRKRIRLTNKAQSLSLSTIVIAAIALLVLVVLTVIFAGRMGSWNQGLKYCDTVCVEQASACSDEGYQIPLYWDSCDDGSTKFDGPSYCCKAEES